MKKEFAKLEFGAYSHKESNWETFQDYLDTNEIRLSAEEEKKFHELMYILYEVIANTTVYDDGSYEITSIECGGKNYYPNKIRRKYELY